MIRKLQFLKTAVLSVFLLGGANLAWAGDFIDDATSITVKQKNETLTHSIETETGNLKFTPTTTDDVNIEFTFSSGYSITPGQAFGIIEASNIVTTNKCRFRKFTIDNKELEEQSAGSVSTTQNNSNTVVLCNFMANGNNTEDKNIPKYFANNVDNTSLTISKVSIYVGVSEANKDIVITTVGVHTLGEILKTYSGFCTSHDWQYVSISSPRIEMNGTGGNTIKIKDVAGGTATMAQIKLFTKSLGLSDMPSAYTTLNFANLTPSETTTCLTKDVFANVGTRTLKMKHEYMHLLPTLATKLQDSNNTIFYRHLDGVTTPSSITPSPNTTSGQQWAVYTRELKAGYNSCIMPFKHLAGESYIPTGITFYKVGALNDGKLIFEKISSPSTSKTFTDGTNWTPVIIKAETEGVYTFVGRDGNITETLTGYKPKIVGNSGTEPNCIYWVGSFVNKEPDGDYASSTNYGISTDGKKILKMAADTKTTYYRAFIADKRPATSRALSISFDEGDGTTAIVSPEAVDGLTTKSVYYDLQGRRVANPSKGLYIVNGKKVIIK